MAKWNIAFTSGQNARSTRSSRFAAILPATLVIVSLLALTMAGFIFFVQSEMAGSVAYADQQQARLAAESGFEEVVAILRTEKHNAAVWFDNPQRLRHALVWGETYNRESDPVRRLGSRQEMLSSGEPVTPAWRYSVVASNLDGPPDTMRYGITPESAKLNINTAPDEQISRLLEPILIELGIENPLEIINAILDWRDQDDTPRDGSAENEYYNTMEPPYNAKNGAFDTIEELLLVKDVSPAVLYGEDVNRNGILDDNEDDGDVSFPFYDNADGLLNHGIAPYLTCLSRELDSALDNKPRINLNADENVIRQQAQPLIDAGTLDPALVEKLLSYKSGDVGFEGLGSVGKLYFSPEELADPEIEIDGTIRSAPLTPEELPVVMDRFTVRPPNQAQRPIFGLINVNAAPIRILTLVPGIDADAATAIVAGRRGLGKEALLTLAWLVTQGLLDAAKFREAAPFLTTKAYQIHIEVLGYADHRKLARRNEWIIEMLGPLPQIRYQRDLSSLGIAWPIDDDQVIVTTR